MLLKTWEKKRKGISCFAPTMDNKPSRKTCQTCLNELRSTFSNRRKIFTMLELITTYIWDVIAQSALNAECYKLLLEDSMNFLSSATEKERKCEVHSCKLLLILRSDSCSYIITQLKYLGSIETLKSSNKNWLSSYNRLFISIL